RDMDADRRDLAWSMAAARRHPHPGESLVAHALDLERGQCADERLLEVTDVALDVLAVLPEIQDRVADELSRPMEGGLAAAIRLCDLDLGGLGDVELEVGLGAAPHRHDRGMLEEHDSLGDRALRD